MNTVNGTLASLVVVLGGFTVPAMAQKTLYIVDSEGKELEQVALDEASTVDLLADGVRAQASGYSCSAEVSCDADVAIEEFSISHDGSTYTDGDQFTIEQGQCFNATWSTLGAWAVEGAGLSGSGWAGADKGFSGSQQVCTSNVSTDIHDLSLRPYNCGGNGDGCGVEKVQTVFAEVVEATSEPEEPAPEGCGEVPQLSETSNWTQEFGDTDYTSGTSDPSKYEGVFGDVFPGTSNTRHFALKTGRYASMQFKTPQMSSNDEIKWTFEEPLGTFKGNVAGKHVTISKCPGVFDPAYLEEDCMKSAYLFSFQAVGPGHKDADRRCELKSGEIYYLNILHSWDSLLGSDPEPADCKDSLGGCGSTIAPTFNF